MREIKFRVFHKKDGMRYFGETMMYILLNGDLYIEEGNGSSIKLPDTAFKIMQFTGLKDAKGNDIYEGDIVEVTLPAPYHHPLNWEVYFDTNYACYKFRWRRDKKVKEWNCKTFREVLTGHQGGNGTMQVIGNIHENPELI